MNAIPQLRSLLDISVWVQLIEFAGALFITGYVLAALITLVRVGGITQARLLVIAGVIWGLDFKVAGSLLKTILVARSWDQIAIFAAILALRTVLKRVFLWERGQLLARRELPQTGT